MSGCQARNYTLAGVEYSVSTSHLLDVDETDHRYLLHHSANAGVPIVLPQMVGILTSFLTLRREYLANTNVARSYLSEVLHGMCW